MDLILASASPRRKELLEKMGVAFAVIPAKGAEHITQAKPAEAVLALARQKAEEIAAGQRGDCLILGADTIVVKDGQILGKPKDRADAYRMLRMLSGDCHQVYTGVALLRRGREEREIAFAEKTDVFLYPISDADIWAYIESGEPMDKAGAYGIQGSFAIHVQKIEGDYYNVVGLPIGRVYQEWKGLLAGLQGD